jgi:hypothetical protein
MAGSNPETTIETYRDGPVVRTRVVYKGYERDLPWLVDCFTHRGARRKARRAIRLWERRDNPRREVVDV